MIAISFLLLLPVWSRSQRCVAAFSITPVANSKQSARMIETETITATFRGTPKRTTSKTVPSLSRLFGNKESSSSDDDIHDDSTLTSTSTLSTSKEAHALEVFEKHCSSGAYEGQRFISKPSQLQGILEGLDLDATLEDAEIVFRFLDTDGDGRLVFNDEFLPWYLDAVHQATEISRIFQSMLVGRRTVNEFDKTPVDDAILKRAVQCAVAAPNRSLSEPWRFLSVGPSTVEKLAVLNTERTEADAEKGKFTTFIDWATVAPGWCVLTMKLTGDGDNKEQPTTNNGDDIGEFFMPAFEQEDFKSVCCAVQNFMLSMWSEGIGTKWTTGPVQKTPEFAELCGIDQSKERVVGIIWYGYATDGAKQADPRRRKLSVDDVLGYLP